MKDILSLFCSVFLVVFYFFPYGEDGVGTGGDNRVGLMISLCYKIFPKCFFFLICFSVSLSKSFRDTGR